MYHYDMVLRVTSTKRYCISDKDVAACHTPYTFQEAHCEAWGHGRRSVCTKPNEDNSHSLFYTHHAIC